MSEQTYQVRKGVFLVFSPDASMGNLKCQNGTHSEIHLRKGTQQILISPSCQGFFAKHRGYGRLLGEDGQQHGAFQMGLGPAGIPPCQRDQGDVQNFSAMSVHLPDLTELHYANKLWASEGVAELGFNRLHLGLSHLSSNLFNRLTSVGMGFFLAVVDVTGILLFLYC